MNGVNIWIAFKVVLIMPLSGLYAWYLTRLMQRYRIPDEKVPIKVDTAPVARVHVAETGSLARRLQAPPSGFPRARKQANAKPSLDSCGRPRRQ